MHTSFFSGKRNAISASTANIKICIIKVIKTNINIRRVFQTCADCFWSSVAHKTRVPVHAHLVRGAGDTQAIPKHWYLKRAADENLKSIGFHVRVKTAAAARLD